MCENSWCIAILIPTLTLIMMTPVKGLLCYRCDNMNHGETCENKPAAKHLRDYVKSEPCLSFEEANDQYLALQKAMDTEWYFEYRNGDHGLPLRVLTNISGPEEFQDHDSVCVFIQAIFHHDYSTKSQSVSGTPVNILWFRKCIQMPALDTYPTCATSPIYKGEVHVCVCRTDKCNMDQEPAGLTMIGAKSGASTKATMAEVFLLFIFLQF